MFFALLFALFFYYEFYKLNDISVALGIYISDEVKRERRLQRERAHHKTMHM